MIKKALGESGYYFITSSSDNPMTDRPVFDTVKDALEGGAKIIQLREKRPYMGLLKLASDIQILAREYGALFIMNDYVGIAAVIYLDGVHVGQQDTSCSISRDVVGEDRIVGVSVNTIEQARAAVAAGADYLGVGPIYSTRTKLDAKTPCGPGLLTGIRQEFPEMPFVAIGGVDYGNCTDMILAGADGVCAISSVHKLDDIAEGVRRFNDKIRSAKENLYARASHG